MEKLPRGHTPYDELNLHFQDAEKELKLHIFPCMRITLKLLDCIRVFRETEPIGHVYIYREIDFMELVHAFMESGKSMICRVG